MPAVMHQFRSVSPSHPLTHLTDVALRAPTHFVPHRMHAWKSQLHGHFSECSLQVRAVAAAEPAAPAMKVVEVDLGDRTYPIYIGRGLLDQGELLRKHIPGKTVLIVTNETIAPLYLDRCAEGLRRRGDGPQWGQGGKEAGQALRS